MVQSALDEKLYDFKALGVRGRVLGIGTVSQVKNFNEIICFDMLDRMCPEIGLNPAGQQWH